MDSGLSSQRVSIEGGVSSGDPLWRGGRGGGGCYVRRMFAAQSAYEAGIGFTRFAHGIVAAVEVFALFELVLQEVFFVGEFAVEAEEFLLFLCELLVRHIRTRSRGPG